MKYKVTVTRNDQTGHRFFERLYDAMDYCALANNLRGTTTYIERVKESDFCAYCKKEIKGKMIIESLPILKIRLGFVGGSFHLGCFRKHEKFLALAYGHDDLTANEIADDAVRSVK
mgnify:CR=1 FL=1